ncbi:uncharacterized protein BDZ99DRAFT_466120 [Mytilinidion resinicola]|uniref:UbiA prenyltransferase n=1 Tax=Mytilinidion resinicola TaxID=574789 RepID=A0A6A6YEW5_9PEZI|nr:uncharacterized protein BDZ99DRAFT_466120 [Mytilinidion resinicola]KAF2806554.1 hypothetical protein BDZ99DRAFT_466120 [Mytilinidion resinicola]
MALCQGERRSMQELKMTAMNSSVMTIGLAPKAAKSVLYFLETLFLFSKSDIPTYVVPCTLFGTLSTLAGSSLTSAPVSVATLLFRVPTVALWAWLFCVLFNCSNQRSPDSVLEDKINKPHRPIPAGRITSSQTNLCMAIGVPAVLLLNYFFLGAWEEMAIMYTVMYLYNDLQLGDNFFWKNFLIATAGNGVYNAGSLRLASGTARASYFTSNASDLLTPTAMKWIALVSSAVLITMHLQDLRDLEGDRARDRRTLPIVFGEKFARWSIAVPVMLFSIAAASFWKSGIIGYTEICVPGAVVAYRVMFLRGTKHDRKTYTLWAVWLMALYALPLLKSLP